MSKKCYTRAMVLATGKSVRLHPLTVDIPNLEGYIVAPGYDVCPRECTRSGALSRSHR